MTDHVLSRPLDQQRQRLAIRRIDISDVQDALQRGFEDFVARPSHVFFLMLIYPIAGILIGAFTSHDALMPIFFPLAAGFALLGPFAATGLYEMSRRREMGEEPTLRAALKVLHSPSTGAIAELAGLLMLVFIVWLVAAMMIYRLTIGSSAATDYPSFLTEILTTRAGWALILIGNAVGFLFAALAFCIGAVSFPLLVDCDVGLATALRASFTAVWRNPVPMAAWALSIAVLLVLGTLPFFVGLALVLPVLGHATWHMYRKLLG